MTVEKLKSILNRILENLQDYEGSEEVRMVSNTYFLGGCKYFLGVSGYDGGYIDLDNPVEEDDEEEY